MEGIEDASYYEAAFSDGPEMAEPKGYADDEAIDEEVETDTYNLIYLGELTERVEFGNHVFKMKTLKIGEELEASIIAHRYNKTIDSGRALATALVAASIVTVDGSPLIEELGPQEITLDAKFKYITENWYWLTVATLYDAYDGLLNRSLKVLDELKKD